MGLESPEEYRVFLSRLRNAPPGKQAAACEEYRERGSEYDAVAVFCADWYLKHPSEYEAGRQRIDDKWDTADAQLDASQYSWVDEATAQTGEDLQALREDLREGAGQLGRGAAGKVISEAETDSHRVEIAKLTGQEGTCSGEGGARLQNDLREDAQDIAERGGETLYDQGEGFAVGVGLGVAGKIIGRYVRRSLPALPTQFAREFDGPIQARTFRAGERVYRSPWVPTEAAGRPGSWFGTRRTATSTGTNSMYQIEKWNNPNQVLRTYEFAEDVTVYYGRVKGGTGYQVLVPADVTPGDVLSLVVEVPLK
jgi:hypothetical protein